MATVIDQVRAVAQKYNVPEWIWRPIMDLESGGNPNARSVSSVEDSRGLFQINTLAHPQYNAAMLYDPTYNATVAFQDFIVPAYAKIAGDTGLTPGQQAAYVWRYGIRPQWTTQKEAAITAKANTYAATTPQPGNTQIPWINSARAWIQQFYPEAWRDQPGKSPLPFARNDSQGNPIQRSPIPAWLQAIFDKLGGGLVSGVLLILGLVILVLVLKSMFLGGETIVVQGKGGNS